MIGNFSISYDYVVTYPGVWLSATNLCALVQLDLRPGGGAGTANGTGSLHNYTWSDSEHYASSTASDGPSPCAFQTSIILLDAHVSIQGATTLSRDDVGLTSGLTDPQSRALDDILSTKQHAVCDKASLPNNRTFDDTGAGSLFPSDFVVSSGNLRPPNIALQGAFVSQSSNSATFGQKLARGQSFTVKATRTLDMAVSSSTLRGTASMSINLRRR